MKKSAWGWIVVIIIIILGIWYFTSMKKTDQSDVAPYTDVSSNTSSSGVKPNIAEPGVVPLVKISTDATLGKYLVASNGMTVYTYSKDTKGVSNCTNACATTWTPYTTTAGTSLVVGEGVTGDFSVISRTDGGKQLTYKGMPLYFYKNDAKAGDTTGQNFGGVWFVVKP